MRHVRISFSFTYLYSLHDKELASNLIRQKKQPGALNSNDVTACYDRITHSMASLCLQRNGVSDEPLICIFTTIQNMEHHIRTIYGDSDDASFGCKLIRDSFCPGFALSCYHHD
jgi:hypothetical protein